MSSQKRLRASTWINSPAIVRGGWVIVKALLDADTLSKCKVLGGPSSYEPLFKQLGITFTEGSTPLSEMPAELGGRIA